MKPLLRTVLLSLLLINSAYGDSSFEGKKGIVDRSAYKLFGGQVESMRIDSSGHVYAGLLSPNGIVCTSDGGTTWSTPAAGVDLGNVHAVAVKPDGSAIFVIAGVGLFRSTDGCVNWTKLSAIDADYSFEVEFANGVLLAPSKSGIIDRSTDDGATLSHITVAAGVTKIEDIAVSPTANEFFALAASGNDTTLYHSTDGGATWTSTGKTGSYKTLAVDPSNAQHLLIGDGMSAVEESTNGGTSWAPLTINPPPGGTGFSFVGNKLFVSRLYTTDGGTTWHNIDQESTSTSELTHDPARPFQILLPPLSTPVARRAVYDISHVGGFVGNFEQACILGFLRGIFHLQLFSPRLGDGFVIGKLEYQAGHTFSKLGLELPRRGLCIFNRIVQDSRSEHFDIRYPGHIC